jgi:ribosomal protein S18 acetylase RimI-like enzyme
MASRSEDRSLVIRRYLSTDCSAVWDLHVKALEAVGARAEDADVRGVNDDLKDIERMYLKSGGEFLVGLLDRQIVAMGALKRLSPSVAEVTRMRVDPIHWRRGHGQAVLQRLETAAIKFRYSEIWLDTLPIQTAAQALYRKNGYTEFARIYIRGYQATEAILFRKTVQADVPENVGRGAFSRKKPPNP